MTEKELKEYIPLKKIKDMLIKKIEAEKLKDIPVVQGKVSGSCTEHPYIKANYRVDMYDPIEMERCINNIKKIKTELKEVEEKIAVIEAFIDSIPDTEIKLIFQYRFQEGLKQKDIAERIKIERSYVSKKINNFLKLSHYSHNSQ